MHLHREPSTLGKWLARNYGGDFNARKKGLNVFQIDRRVNRQFDLVNQTRFFFLKKERKKKRKWVLL